MKLRTKRGFTIVEMLMVIAVLAVLTGIVATAATSAIHKSRVRKNEALRIALQTGIATFYQQEGYWPPNKNGKLQDWANNGLDKSARDRKWSDGEGVACLEPDEYDDLMRELVKNCLNTQKTPVMDVSGLTTTRASAVKSAKKEPDNDENSRCYGEEVRSWVAKQRAKDTRGSTPKSSEMTFGYSNSEKGYFRRFIIYYNANSDSVTVGFAKKNIGKNGSDKGKYEKNYYGEDDK